MTQATRQSEYDDRNLVSESIGRITPSLKRKGEGDPVKAKLTRNNRRRGKGAEQEWADMIHGRRVGLLGREDVDDGFRLFEVKARKLPAWIKEAYLQVDKHQGDQLRYVVIKSVEPGRSAEWWVIQKAEQFIDTNGLGNHLPRPKRLRR